MHVLRVIQVGNAKYCYCECGRPLTVLYDDYSQESLDNLIAGHREHALLELNVEPTWREGSTTQRHEPIDPLLDLPDLKHANAKET